ncbi:MAG UNVERIFIED_CONTAM: hypothetical protein LVT10_02675 [Anaerolineae bacterium]
MDDNEEGWLNEGFSEFTQFYLEAGDSLPVGGVSTQPFHPIEHVEQSWRERRPLRRVHPVAFVLV